ncbi:amidohydrolase family protein [Halalkalicoccus subterraneus]|uniref:amidohydrolase family protein n=1 Tax=Halalkalicoccus subterraneus TaxID=2675002 RepID=UPI000EFC0274|nr:amidohydrolase family protein [Halalkalicoccus subterraneus]
MVDNTTHREETFAHTRRDHLKGVLGGVALSGLSTSGFAYAAAGHADDEDIRKDTEVTVTNGTNIALTASPDGESVVMDLHGLLFRLPREGGEAEQLTDVELEPTQPDYAPDGARIAFQGYVDGNFDVWTMAADGGDIRQMTDGFWDDREPQWSPNGTQIAFSSDRNENYDIWTVDVETGDLQQWTDDSSENFEPTWSPDGTEIAYVADPAGEYGDGDDSPITIEAVNQDGETRTLVSGQMGQTLHSPSWSPNGEDLAYVRINEQENRTGDIDLMVSGSQVTDGEDVFIFTPHWLSTNEILYSADGNVRTLDLDSGATSDVSFSATFDLPAVNYDQKSYEFDNTGTCEVQGILTPRLSPDGEHVAFIALNDLWLMRIGQPPQRITDDPFYQADPAWSPDGRYVAYSSDENGTQDLYVHDLQTGENQQVTARDDAVVAATWSPDGSRIAFQNQHRATLIAEVERSENEVELSDVQEAIRPLFLPGRPTWSADGTTLAVAAVKQYSDRFRSGTSQILTVDVETGEETFYPPGEEFKSLSTRGNDGPVWSPDGRWMAFVVESTLRVMPVDEGGEPTGPATQITEEATDAPTWSGDSEWLLYLNNGTLKKVRRDGSETRDVPVRQLNYHRDQPAGRTVIHVGKLWDGTSQDIQEDVNITVVNNRIQKVVPDSEPPNSDYVDASELTVIPGLWDSHVHQTFSDRFFGDRMGRINLAYGITSTVSPGDRVYSAIEQREAIESGDRIGPRFFASGEPIDGSRVYYGFIGRPTTSLKQIPLELSRAIELDYDFVKTYVRLNAKRIAAVTDVAHEELGVPVKSHYLAPGAFVGQDGTTHLSATQRLGYARTESATNQTYDDVINLYGEGERSVITTVFTSDFILADDVEDDPRLQLFIPGGSIDTPGPTGLAARDDLRENVTDNTEFPSDSDCETSLCRNVTTFKNIFDAGGVVLTGTDMPLDYPGIGVHGNLRPLAAYGFSPYEALLTATRFAAEEQGVDDDLGTLESGKLADMVFVEGNPLKQIEDAIDVRMTMKNGELFTVQDLVEPFSASER